MALLNRGRLSVQPVEEAAYNVIQELAENGGWEEGSTSNRKRQKAGKNEDAAQANNPGKAVAAPEEHHSETDLADSKPKTGTAPKPTGKKRKAADESPTESALLRRSTRSRK